MKVINNSYRMSSFGANQNETNADKNPINTAGERANLLKVTAVAGLGVGAKALLYFWEEGFEFQDLFNWGIKIVDKNKPGAKNKQLLYFGAFAALVTGFIGAVAAIYTLSKTPEIMYNGKVNAFKKGKDMDVYIKGNKVERELYDQMNEKAENATPEEKKILAQQYLKLKAAKNQIPDYILPEEQK